MNAVSRSRWWRAAAAFASSIAVAATGSAWSAAALGSTPDGSAAEVVEQVLEQQLDAAGISGGAVALVSEGRVDARGVGDVDGDRLATAETPFVIGSATKSLTALAVMQLVDSGEVDLDAPVRDYVPELELGRGRPVDEITVREVLQQTSGLDDLAGGPLLASAADGSPPDAVAELKDAELASTPGETWRYANVNYVLAGLVVERASGVSYGDYVQHEIFDPLGMTTAPPRPGPSRGDVVADGHRFWFGVPVATEPTRRSATLAAGYLISTAEDLGRYLSIYLADGVGPDGTRIVSARWRRGPCSARDPRLAWAPGRRDRTPATRWAGSSADPGARTPSSTPATPPTPPPCSPCSPTGVWPWPPGQRRQRAAGTGQSLHRRPGHPQRHTRRSRSAGRGPAVDVALLRRLRPDLAAPDRRRRVGAPPGCADLRCSPSRHPGVGWAGVVVQDSGCRPARRLPAAELRLGRPVDLVARPRRRHRRRGPAAGRRGRRASDRAAAAPARHPTRHLPHRRETSDHVSA